MLSSLRPRGACLFHLQSLTQELENVEHNLVGLALSDMPLLGPQMGTGLADLLPGTWASETASRATVQQGLSHIMITSGSVIKSADGRSVTSSVHMYGSHCPPGWVTGHAGLPP